MLLKSGKFILSSIVLFSSLTFSALGDDDLRNAVIKDLKNQVEIKKGASLWRTASLNQMVVPGAQIRTGANSKVELLYPDGTVTRIGSRTTLAVLDKASRAIKLAKGKIWFKVAKKSVGYKIYSPTAMAAITGTEGFVDFDDKSNDKDSMLNHKLASSNKNFFIAENPASGSYNAGLVEGSMDIYKGADDDGNPIGDPNPIGAGQVFGMSGDTFQIQKVDTDSIYNQYNEISKPDANGNSGDNNNNNNNNNSDKDKDKDKDKNNNNDKDKDKDQNNNNNNTDKDKNNNNNNNNGNLNNNNNNNNNSNVKNENLGPNNVTTDKQPNLPNNNQNLNNSPTTGDLEIIIK